MIPRYSRPDMAAIWEPEARYRIWFEIEAHATDALAELGVVPASAAEALWRWWATNPRIDVAAIDAIEAVTKHDVIAFLTWVAEQVGDEARCRTALADALQDLPVPSLSADPTTPVTAPTTSGD